MKKADIILAVLTGLVLAWFISGIFQTASIKEIFGIKTETLSWILLFSLPVLAVFGLWVCYIIGKKFSFVFQLGKFLMIGALATLFDLQILSFLTWFFGKATGIAYSLFKAISFIAATIAKYWANKFLAFEKKEMSGVRQEFTQFFIVTFIGLGINVGVASFVVNTIGPQFGLNEQVWGSVGGIAAAFVGFAWNFLGYKFVVFKK